MNITVTKNVESQTIDVVLNNDGILRGVFHTIKKVSGIDITHGSGAKANTTLKYFEVVDGSTQTTKMHLSSIEVGDGEIFVEAHVYLQSDLDKFESDNETHYGQFTTDEIAADKDSDGNSIHENRPAFPEFVILTSPNITLTFDDSKGTYQFS